MVKEIKPHIQLENFSHGLFPNERIGSFNDYNGEKQYLELQTCNANFTKYGLLEVSVLQSEGDKALIQARNECSLRCYVVKKDDLRRVNTDTLRYDKNDFPYVVDANHEIHYLKKN